MFASQLTAYLGVVGLVATVVVATQYSNSTDGLTFVVIVLTAYLVLTEPKRRLEQRELFWRYLADAVYETCHNLQHIAKVYTAKSSLETWPDFHLRAALRLIDPPFNDYMLRAEPHLWPHLDHMIRNDLYMQRYPFTPEGAQAGKDLLGYFVEHSLRFIIAAGRAKESKAGPYVSDVIEKLGRNELTGLVLSGGATRFHVRITRERAERDLAERRYHLNGNEQPVCWFGEQTDPHALWRVFHALTDPPPRPGFSDSVIQV